MTMDIKSFLGLTSTEKVEEFWIKTIKETQIDFANKIKEHHKLYEQKQEELEKTFSYNILNKININIWDDFYDDGYVPEGEFQETFAYVDDSDIPNKEAFKILSTLVEYINTNNLLPQNVEMEIKFRDKVIEYPILVVDKNTVWSLTKKWEINFKYITHEILEKMVEKLKNFPQINNTKVMIYSES